MVQITTREVGPYAKGSPLSNAEFDNNLINLKTSIDNLESGHFDTGLAVTGALSASGTITNNGPATNRTAFSASTSGTGFNVIELTSTGGSLTVGLESSTGSPLGTGVPYSTAILSANPVVTRVGGNTITNTDSTGLAVTGRLKASLLGAGAAVQVLTLVNTGAGANTKAQLGFYAAGSRYAGMAGGYGPSFPEITWDIQGTNYLKLSSTGLAVTGALSADGALTVGTSASSQGILVNGAASGSAGGSSVIVQNGGNARIAIGNYSNLLGGAYDATSTLWSSSALRFYVGGGTAATLDTSGNLGLGVTPKAWHTSLRAIQVGYSASIDSSTSIAYTRWSNNAFIDSSGDFKYINTAVAQAYEQTDNGKHVWYTAPSGTAGNAISFGNPKLMLDASGNLLVGTSSLASSDSNSVMFQAAAGAGYFQHANGTNSSTIYCQFNYNATIIGSITQNGTTAVAYNTTSDHRLKLNVRDANATRFMDIKFRDFEWTDGRHDCGVIAHELQQVYPDLVLGAKDATEVRTVEITPAVPAVTERRLVTPAIPAVVAVEARAAVAASPAEYTTVTTDEVVLIDGVETTITRTKLVETKPAVEAQPAVEAVAAVEAVEAVYEDVVITPAVPAVTEEQTFPVYQQVNYIGLIGRIGVRVQQLQRTVDAQAALIATMETRLTALEARLA